MTFRISRGVSRRRFLATAGAGAMGALAIPYLSRAADRPQITHGVQSGDVGTDGGVVWARADRPSHMMVEVATTESFSHARVLPPIAALPESDFTAKMLLENLPAGQEIFYRVRFRDLAHSAISSEPAIGRFRTAPADRRDVSFVWAVPKQGPAGFALIRTTANEIERKVRKLREALEPAAEKITDIPSFDLALAYDLYKLLLAPVEASWKPARNLVVVTNGALGVLPLALLPTVPPGMGALPPGDVPFAEYRQVRWLVRDHTITNIPSTAALKAIRQLPPGSDAREPLIGFGDPVFETETKTIVSAAPGDRIETASLEASGLALRRRAVPQTRQIASASLALLPTLPDTADELRSIALSLQADPTRALNLGRDASERKVKSTDLSRYRIVAFSTHGLLPGDLDGLTQPALALSAPGAVDAEGDGILTAEEVLALRLDADWVVLSACNTGVGAAVGAEALSGLGQAFLYAGTRTLLVTNWSVHSPSAADLVAALFKRQRVDSGISRAEALRGAMLEVMDGPGATGRDGRTLFTYAHPLFWAPFSMVGDGGG